MALWNVVITVTDLPQKRVRVDATRTDGENVWKHSVQSIIDTKDLPGTRDRINGTIWAAWQKHLAKMTQIAALITGYETALAANLNEREGV